MSNKIKHEVLKELHKVYNNNPDLPNDKVLGIISRSLSFDHLKKKLKISNFRLDQNVQYLVLNEEVVELHKNAEHKDLNYKLNEKGCKSFYAKFYYNQVWFRDKKFIVSIIALLISLFTFGLTYYTDNSIAKKSSDLENRMIIIEKKLNNPNKNFR